MNAEQMLETEVIHLLSTRRGSLTPNSLARVSTVTRHPARIGSVLRRLGDRGIARYCHTTEGWTLNQNATLPTEDQMKQLTQAAITNIAHRNSLHRIADNDACFAL